MLLIVEVLLIILRSMGTGHSIEYSASVKCMIKCMGARVLGYSRLFAVSFFLSLACHVRYIASRFTITLLYRLLISTPLTKGYSLFFY